MPDIVLFKFDISLGPNFTGICRIGATSQKLDPDSVDELRLPEPNLPDEPSPFQLLSWESRISDFQPREPEWKQLEVWAKSPQAISIKFITGTGGVGKSRLAAEFARHLKIKRWSAGFVNLSEIITFRMHKAGTLLIIDYPEEHISQVQELLTKLSKLKIKAKLRILFLSRQPKTSWDYLIANSRAELIEDPEPLPLASMDKSGSYHLYESALANAAIKLKTSPPPLTEEAFAAWLELAREHTQPLFIIALAVYSASHPKDLSVQYSSREIVAALVAREVKRLRGIADEMGCSDDLAIARLVAMAAIDKNITPARIEQLRETDALNLGLPAEIKLQNDLESTGILMDGRVRAPVPDIVAGAFVINMFGRDLATAPEAVWCALEADIIDGWQRISRLCYDAEIILGIHYPRLGEWLSEALNNQLARCIAIREVLFAEEPYYGLVHAAITCGKTILEKGDPNERSRSKILIVHSNHLDQAGDISGALLAIQQAVKILRRLASFEPDKYELDLCGALNNLSLRLGDNGDNINALEAVRESIEIRRRLASVAPALYEPELASSLNNLSVRLSIMEHNNEAMESIREVVEIYRRLAIRKPELYEQRLGDSLQNLSLCLGKLGEQEEALEAIKETTAIFRRLAATAPERFEPDLADSLNNLSTRLSAAGDVPAGVEAINEAVELRRRLATAAPEQFEPSLANTLGAQAHILALLKRVAEAADRIHEAIGIITPYAEQYPESTHASLLMNLTRSLKEMTGEED